LLEKLRVTEASFWVGHLVGISASR
jgi:hypothetical protein